MNTCNGSDKQSEPHAAGTSRPVNSLPSKHVASASSTQPSKEAGELITDIEPFLFDRAVTYVGVGANVGNMLKSLLDSTIGVRTAHLIEPNPRTFATLKQTADALLGAKQLKQVSCHNLALGAMPGTLALRDASTMTHVLPQPARREGTVPDGVFEISAITLDALAELNKITHIDLLKVDVKGHELAVFDGAERLLGAQAIDVIYVEAGLDPTSNQQTYYRTIEDKLNNWGYRLFRIYEQKNEWIEDSPFLRRANLAFMSARFAASNPYKVSRKLFDARRNERALAAEAAELRKQTQLLSEKLKDRDQELRETGEKLSEAVAKRKDYWQKIQSLTEINADLAQLSSRDAKIADLTQQSQAREAEKTAAETQAKQLQKELGILTAKLEAETGRTQREIEKLKSSTSWRITAPIRLLKETVSPSKKTKRR